MLTIIGIVLLVHAFINLNNKEVDILFFVDNPIINLKVDDANPILFYLVIGFEFLAAVLLIYWGLT